MAVPIAAAPASASPAQRLMTDVLGLSGRKNPADDLRAADTRKDAPVPIAPIVSDDSPSSESNSVTLSTRANESISEPQLPIVYAEVWRAGIKVAMIDANGGVRSLNGTVVSTQGTGGAGGILLAARRAAEIAAAVGGEIRVGGQPIDQNTLTTKAKLSAAYGV